MSSDRLKLLAAVIMLGFAGFFVVRHFRHNDGISEKAFFYDLSEKKLFTVARTSVPPIKGLDGTAEDAVRAVVVSTNGNPADKHSWKIAYLEKYSSEMKAQMEKAQKTGTTPSLSRSQALVHRFVKRVDDPDWVTMDSPEAEKIVSDWTTVGAPGTTPVVCTP